MMKLNVKLAVIFISIFCSNAWAMQSREEELRSGARLEYDAQGLTAIHRAAMLDDVEKLSSLMNSLGADVNVSSSQSGASPLHCAVEFQRKKNLKFLLQQNGVEIDQKDNHGVTPLMKAVYYGYQKGSALLLAAGADKNKCTEDGVTPLFVACQNGNSVIANQLLQAGADVDPAVNNGMTPLHKAAITNNIECVRVMLAHGANPALKMNNGKKPVELTTNSEIIRLIAEAEEKYTIGFNQQESSTCSEGIESEPAAASDCDSHLKLEYDDEGLTALHKLVIFGSIKRLKYLFTFNVDVNVRTLTTGETLLHCAIKHKRREILELLLQQKGINIDQEDKEGVTPLMLAVLCERKKETSLLLNAGADKIKPMNSGETPLYIACQNGYVSIVGRLLSAGAEVDLSVECETPLFVACANGHMYIVERLLQAGADVNRVNAYGSTPLFVACVKGHHSVVEQLLQAGVDANQANTHGETLLFAACLNGHYSVVERLLQAGADANQANTHGETPLFAACYYRHHSVVEQLLQAGADVNQARKSDGIAPLHVASQYGYFDIVNRLLQAGANVNQSETDGFTPLHLAVAKNSIGCVQLLLTHGANPTLQMKDGRTPVELTTDPEIIRILSTSKFFVL